MVTWRYARAWLVARISGGIPSAVFGRPDLTRRPTCPLCGGEFGARLDKLSAHPPGTWAPPWGDQLALRLRIFSSWWFAGSSVSNWAICCFALPRRKKVLEPAGWRSCNKHRFPSAFWAQERCLVLGVPPAVYGATWQPDPTGPVSTTKPKS